MYFLVDYENVRESGLVGAEYLNKNDFLFIFYNGGCSKVSGSYIRQIKKSNCGLTMFKRTECSKNANDFCIAVRVGEIISKDPEAKIGIISLDKGFEAVLNYCKDICPSSNITLAQNIQVSINRVKGETERKKSIYDNCRCSSLDELNPNSKTTLYHSDMQKVETVLNDNGYNDYFSTVILCLNKSTVPIVFYNTLVKELGKDKGLNIYRLVKNLGIQYNWTVNE